MIKVSGTVKDDKNQPIPFANIYVSDNAGVQIGNQGTSSDINGKYSLNIQSASWISFSAIGYERIVMMVPPADALVNAKMKPVSYGIKPVTITADKPVNTPAPTLKPKNTWMWWVIGTAGAATVILVAASLLSAKRV